LLSNETTLTAGVHVPSQFLRVAVVRSSMIRKMPATIFQDERWRRLLRVRSPTYVRQLPWLSPEL
jgi:hypothetical protein